jgi:hypothetical protein
MVEVQTEEGFDPLEMSGEVGEGVLHGARACLLVGVVICMLIWVIVGFWSGLVTCSMPTMTLFYPSSSPFSEGLLLTTDCIRQSAPRGCAA